MGPSLWSLVLSCLLSHTIHASHAGSLNEDALHRLKRSGNAASGADGDDGANNNDVEGPSLSIPTWTVAATGTGTSYAQACDSESAIYDNILSYGITPTGTADVYTTSWATTTNYTAQTTRLCDGRTRVVGSLTPVHVGSVLSSNVPTITYTGPAPSCSVQPSDCSWLRTSYLAAESSYSASLTNFPDAPPGLSPTVPRCYIPGPPLEECGQCTIHGGKVDLLYFPLSTKTTRDMCATTATSPVLCPYGPTRLNDDTVAGFATAPCQYLSTEHTSTTDSGPSTVINGTTLYSNRAYISYDTLYATNSCGRVGGTYSNGLVTVASSDVYSVSGYHFMINHAAYSFNFADLAGPIPASAYLAQASCYDSGSPIGDGDVLNGLYGGRLGFCSTIIDEAFRPRLAVPPQMRHIDPQFENWYMTCLLGLDGLYDPPRLMTSEATLDLPTPYSATASAVPQQAVTAAQNAATPTADSYTDAPDSPDEGGSPSDASTKASALMETSNETTSPLGDSPAAIETGMADGGSQSDVDVTDSPSSPAAAMEPGMAGGGGGGSPNESSAINPAAATETGMANGAGVGSQSENDATNPPSKPTAAMETQSPQLTTPSGDRTATEGDASSHPVQSQLSDISSSNSPDGVVSAKTSSACYNVFPADLYSSVFSCLVLICLVW